MRNWNAYYFHTHTHTAIHYHIHYPGYFSTLL